MKKKINIVWIVNDRYTNNFITVYNECRLNEKFSLTVVATTHLDPCNTGGNTSYEIARYLRSEGIECIDSYNTETDSYFDISTLDPDYVFTTTPYDIYLPEPYRSYNIVKFSKLCYVEYGAVLTEVVGLYEYSKTNPYLSNASFIFNSSPVLKKLPKQYKCIGNLKLDEYLYYGRKPKSNLWNKEAKLRATWKPRWTAISTDSKILEYIQPMYKFLTKNPEIDLTFIVHPLLWGNLKSKGLFIDFVKIYNKFKNLKNFHEYDGADYLDIVLSSDVLLAEHSSTIAEYTITGNAIVYIKIDCVLNKLGKKVIKKAYVVNGFHEVEKTLQNLIIGIDPLKKRREKNKDSYFLIPPKMQSISQYLLSILYNDYNNIF